MTEDYTKNYRVGEGDYEFCMERFKKGFNPENTFRKCGTPLRIVERWYKRYREEAASTENSQ